jgi:predicted glycosyltransferase
MRPLMFCSQYVFGAGRLVRSLETARALARDFDVRFVAGGDQVAGVEVPPNVKLVRLPALEPYPRFEGLRASNPAIELAENRDLRKWQLLALFENVLPEVLLVELFPFGRQQFSFEMIPLLERARENGTFVACGLPGSPVRKQNNVAYEQCACKIANDYFDLILVHGDPALVEIEEVFSRAGDLRCALRYTGYVVRREPKIRIMPRNGHRSIIGSVGGGRSKRGWRLLEALIGAAVLLQQRLPHQFRIFAGPSMPEDAYARLQYLAAGARNIELCKYSPDLIPHLAGADLSVSLGGYKTTMDILRTGVRALILSAEDSADREQALRVSKLERLGVVQSIDAAVLTVPELARRILRSLEQKPRRMPVNLNGPENTRELFAALKRSHAGVA